MEDNMYEQEIDLKDLIFTVLRKWRLILVIALLLGVAAGGYKSGKELLKQKDDVFVAKLREEYNNDLEKYNQTKVGYERDIENYNASITYQEKYKKKSILLTIDPYNKGRASTDIFVKMSDLPKENGITVNSVDFADGVVKAYASGIEQGGALKELAKDNNIELIYLKELIKVTTDYDSNMLNVTVSYPDEKGAQEILSEIINSIKSMYPEIQLNLGNHKIAIMNQDIGVVTDSNLADFQKQKVNDLAQTNQNLKDTEKALEDLEKPEKPVALSKGAILKAGIKYGILGGLAGAFVVGFGICMVFIVNGRVNVDEDLKHRLGIKLLGVYSSKPRKKQFFSMVDRWLDRMEGKEYFTDETINSMIAVNLCNYVNKGDAVLLTGMADEEHLKQLTVRLQEKTADIKLDYAADLIRNVTTLKRISEYDRIVLVETRGSSKYRDIDKEYETIINRNKEVVGYIMLAGE